MHFSFHPRPTGTRSPYLGMGILMFAVSLVLFLFLRPFFRHGNQLGRGPLLLLIVPFMGLLFLLKALIPEVRGAMFRSRGERRMATILRVEHGRSGVNGVYPYRLVLTLPGEEGGKEIRSEWLYLLDYLPEFPEGGQYPVYVLQQGEKKRFYVDAYAFRDGEWTPPESDGEPVPDELF